MPLKCTPHLTPPLPPLPLLPPRRFFESLYAALTALMHEAFDRLGRQAVLEQELGRLFR